MSITLVTGFYDLNKLEKRPSDKTRENYFKWAEYLFKLDINLVFYVDKEDSYYVWQKRHSNNLSHKTLVVRRDFNELKYYNIRDDLETYKKENPIINSLPNKDSPNYIILTWNKMFFVEEIIKLNPFNTTHFGWIDFGIYNVISQNMPKNIITELTPNTPKIRILELRTVFASEIEDLYSYCRQFRWKTAGGLWFGSTECLTKFFLEFKKQLNIIMSLRIFAHEETIMALVSHKNPDLFEPYYGNYHQICINLNKIIVPHDLIFENITNCRQNGNNQKAFKIASKLYTDCHQTLSVNKRFQLYDELLVNGYYTDKQKATEFAGLYVKEITTNTPLREIFLSDKGRQIENIKFLDTDSSLIKQLDSIFISQTIGVILTIKDNTPEFIKAQYQSIINQSYKPTDIYILNYNQDKTIKAFIRQFDAVIINTNTTPNLSQLVAIANNFNTQYICIIDEPIVLDTNWFKRCIDHTSKAEGIYGPYGIKFEIIDNTYELSKIEVPTTQQVDFVYGAYFFKKEVNKYLAKELISIVNKDLYISYIVQKYLNQNTYMIPFEQTDNSEYLDLPLPYSTEILDHYLNSGFEFIFLKQQIKDYTGSLQYFLDKIKAKEPFCLIRYGDGEYYICNNQDYKSTVEDNWSYSAGGILSEHLKQTFKLSTNNSYYGIHAPCDVPKYQNYCLDNIYNKTNITYATLFCNHNFPKFKEFVETTDLPIVLIAPTLPPDLKLGQLTIIDSYIISDKLVQTWSEEHTQQIKNIETLAENHKSDIFLISAGPIAKIFIYHMYQKNPNNIYCDIGSALDYFTKKTISRACYRENHPDSQHVCQF